MRVGDEFSFVEFEFEEKIPQHLQGAGDVSCSVRVACDGFRGEIKSVWFAREDIIGFLSQLQNFEETRKGSVRLLNMSSQSQYNPLHFELFFLDETGQLAVNAQLSKVTYVGEPAPLSVTIAFPLDGGQLKTVEMEFRKLFR